MNRKRRVTKPQAETWVDKEINVEIKGELRRRLTAYQARYDKKPSNKEVFNRALEEYLKNRNA